MKSIHISLIPPLFALLLVTISGAVKASSISDNQQQSQSVTRNLKPLHGNYSTKRYHFPHCKYYNCKKCTIIIPSVDDAKTKGYRACKKCDS